MPSIPPRAQQIALSHAALIHQVVQACHNPERVLGLETVLQASERNGWNDLVAAIRRILRGEREPALLAGLDEEDHAIVTAILTGLQDPASLPALTGAANPAAAAPALAGLIDAASRGDTRALQAIATVAAQMSRGQGEMRQLAAIIGRLVNGERDADRLGQGMGALGRALVLSLLEELARLRPQ